MVERVFRTAKHGLQHLLAVVGQEPPSTGAPVERKVDGRLRQPGRTLVTEEESALGIQPVRSCGSQEF